MSVSCADSDVSSDCEEISTDQVHAVSDTAVNFQGRPSQIQNLLEARRNRYTSVLHWFSSLITGLSTAMVDLNEQFSQMHSAWDEQRHFILGTDTRSEAVSTNRQAHSEIIGNGNLGQDSTSKNGAVGHHIKINSEIINRDCSVRTEELHEGQNCMSSDEGFESSSLKQMKDLRKETEILLLNIADLETNMLLFTLSELKEQREENKKLHQENYKLKTLVRQINDNFSSFLWSARREVQKKTHENSQLRNTIEELRQTSIALSKKSTPKFSPVCPDLPTRKETMRASSLDQEIENSSSDKAQIVEPSTEQNRDTEVRSHIQEGKNGTVESQPPSVGLSSSKLVEVKSLSYDLARFINNEKNKIITQTTSTSYSLNASKSQCSYKKDGMKDDYRKGLKRKMEDEKSGENYMALGDSEEPKTSCDKQRRRYFDPPKADSDKPKEISSVEQKQTCSMSWRPGSDHKEKTQNDVRNRLKQEIGRSYSLSSCQGVASRKMHSLHIASKKCNNATSSGSKSDRTAEGQNKAPNIALKPSELNSRKQTNSASEHTTTQHSHVADRPDNLTEFIFDAADNVHIGTRPSLHLSAKIPDNQTGKEVLCSRKESERSGSLFTKQKPSNELQHKKMKNNKQMYSPLEARRLSTCPPGLADKDTTPEDDDCEENTKVNVLKDRGLTKTYPDCRLEPYNSSNKCKESSESTGKVNNTKHWKERLSTTKNQIEYSTHDSDSSTSVDSSPDF